MLPPAQRALSTPPRHTFSRHAISPVCFRFFTRAISKDYHIGGFRILSLRRHASDDGTMMRYDDFDAAWRVSIFPQRLRPRHHASVRPPHVSSDDISPGFRLVERDIDLRFMRDDGVLDG